PTSSYDYATVAYDASNGALLWVRRYNGPANDVAFALGVSPDSAKVFVSGYIYGGSTSLYDYATSIGVSPDGSKLFVAGYSRGTLSSYDYATVAYEASSGALLWVRRYNGPGNDDDSPTALGVSPDGSKVIVTGVSTGLGTNSDY